VPSTLGFNAAVPTITLVVVVVVVLKSDTFIPVNPLSGQLLLLLRLLSGAQPCMTEAEWPHLLIEVWGVDVDMGYRGVDVEWGIGVLIFIWV